MSRLSDLLRAASQLDPQLAKDLTEEIQPLQRRLRFGLNFERHAPEAVELAGHKIRRASKVRVLPPRGDSFRGDRRIWRVESISKGEAVIVTPNGDDVEVANVPLDDLILVAEFRDRIYPGLRADGEVRRGGDKPFHTVINGENFHVLEQLTFTHARAVDAIYIDPPYNTGARDWKYNNDYVEGDDLYRHSKWLAFMERRLKIAKVLLNPDRSVLIVTIDEKEYLRLGLLLEQIFPEANIQMVTSSIKPSGSQRGDEFSRVEEFIYFVMLGEAHPSTSNTDMLRDAGSEAQLAKVTWQGLRRRGSTDWKREHRPNGFYPIFVSMADGRIHSVGEPVPLSTDRHAVAPPSGTWAAWPLDPRGAEGRWQISPDRLREQLKEGTAALRSTDFQMGSASIVYLKGGDLKAVRSGEFKVDGRDAEGKLNILPTSIATRKAKTMWLMPSHDASAHGTALLSRFLPDRQFPFPKSLYAVEDALRFFVGEKLDAVVLDFFSGSGTTAHAVMRLNRQDGGRRQCISVTNNEVSAEEQTKLRKRGLRPGDPDWERRGICDHITKPRIRAAITGKTPEGDSIAGDYRFTDEFPMADGFAENAAFFTLTYESPFMVSTDRAFSAIAPMLWLRAGARGERIDSIASGWAVAEAYGILRDLDLTAEFIEALKEHEAVRVVYVVTDDEGRYQQVASELKHVETVRLYEDYLRNCESIGDF